MATFTVSLKRALEILQIETSINDASGITVVDREASKKIGLGYFPIFDEAYRNTLTGKIIDHYWNREIGQETIEMFKLALRRKMNEIMPYYNKMYLSEQISFDPLATVDLHTIQDVTNSGTSNSTSGNVAKSRSVASETPQTILSGDADYATSAADVSGTTDVTNAATDASTQDVTTDVTGFQGIASQLLMSYRDALLNIDVAVIRDLQELFMQVWDTADAYTNRQPRGLFY